ncbi:MAG TPA: CoA-transferase [Acidimicrobiales bacterium]|nr:CoA-transferase [Acidimicrobiales bacterium]HYB91754.1 CoA-transferase [Candidatus Binataceae bacterium]
MRILEEGKADFFKVDPDGYRAYVRDKKPHQMVSKLMTEKEAVERFVHDGDYLAYDCNYFQRGPAALIREVIRQRKKNLWVCGKFTYVAVALLVDSGCADKVDIGFIGFGPWISRAVREKKATIYEYSNAIMTLRLKAGAMGLPFLPARSFGGTDGFGHSGCKVVEDPYTHQPVILAPALNPDVALIHVHQADEYGNARVFGTGITHQECALASKRVIVSAEEIISTDEVRRDPARTSIPHFAVDAVVHMPYGAYPGTVQGYYASDPAGVVEAMGGMYRGDFRDYLAKHVYSVASHEEYLEKVVGAKKLVEIRRRESIREGYGS